MGDQQDSGNQDNDSCDSKSKNNTELADIPPSPHIDNNATGNKKRPTTHQIAQHYNERQDTGKRSRQESPIIGLRNFNNWVKAVLIDRYVGRSGLHDSQNRGGDVSVLDLACGKGGDLLKWKRAKIRHLVGIDIAESSIKDARQRYVDMGGKGIQMDASFHAFDAFHTPIKACLQENGCVDRFHFVGCMFALHYCFETEESARVTLQNVRDHLAPGGYFFGCTTNAKMMMKRFSESVGSRDDGEATFFSNSISRIQADFEVDKALCEDSTLRLKQPFGHQITFTLEGVLSSCPEYLIPINALVPLCSEHDLRLVATWSFRDFYQKYSQDPQYRSMFERMMGSRRGGAGRRMEDSMSEEECAVADLYLTFCFERV